MVVKIVSCEKCVEHTQLFVCSKGHPVTEQLWFYPVAIILMLKCLFYRLFLVFSVLEAHLYGR